MPSPKILFVATEQPWPIRGGVTAKSGRLIDALRDVGAQVTVITPAEEGEQHARIVRVASRARSVLQALPPAAAGLPPRATLQRLEAELTTQTYDVVHLDIISNGALLPGLARLRDRYSPSTVIVLSVNDCYSLYRSDVALSSNRWKEAVSRRLIRRYETRVYPLADVVDVVAPTDRDEIRRLAPGSFVRTIPLGAVALGAAASNERPLDIVLFPSPSGMAPLVELTLPKIKALRPDTNITLVGAPVDDADHRRALLAMGASETGFVDDLAEILDRAKLVIAPSSQRAGTPNKAVQGMAHGAAVVGERCLYGIEGFVDGQHGYVREHGEPMARAAVSLLQDEPLRTPIAAAGRDLVGRRLTWSDVATKYLSTLPRSRLTPTRTAR